MALGIQMVAPVKFLSDVAGSISNKISNHSFVDLRVDGDSPPVCQNATHQGVIFSPTKQAGADWI